MSNVDPEEVEALLGSSGAEKKERVVDARDFSSPRRLSGAQRERLAAVLAGTLGGLEAHFTELLGGKASVEVGSIGEVNATTLFAGDGDVPCVLSFRIEGAAGWAIWESATAVAAVEGLLGASSGKPEARALSTLETSVLVDILEPVVSRLASTLSATCEAFEVVQVQQDLELAASTAAETDPHRLEIELAVRLGEEGSSLRCYFPGVRAGAEAAASADEAENELPPAATAIPVQVHARLTGCDVPLSQLLSLAPGDVIPLEDKTDEPITVFVGETRYGTAQLGTRNGHLALRMEQIG